MYEKLFYNLKRNWLIIFSAMIVCISGHAQQSAVDSLQQIISSRSGVDQYDPLIQLFIHYANYDYDKAFETADRAYEVAGQAQDSAKLVRARRIKGQLLNKLDRSKEAIEILNECLPVARRNGLKNEIKIILNNLALAYTIQADYEKALKINFETLLLREADGDKAEISISLNNIGYVYFKLKNYKTALDFFNKAIAFKKEVNDTYDFDRLLINTGLCLNQLSRYDEAQQKFTEAFQICGGDCSSQILLEGMFGLGVSFYSQDNLKMSKKSLTKSLEISRDVGRERFVAENYIYLAHIYRKEKNIDSTLFALKNVEQIASKYKYNELLISAYSEYSVIYNFIRDFENASLYQNKYITLKDSVINADLIDKLAKIQTDYAERENRKIIASQDEVIERQRSLTFAIIIIAVLTTMLVFVLYRGNRVKKKVNRALSDAKAIIEDQNRQLLNSNYNLDRELKEKNNELEKANESLLRVNDELDNFIYKTSHDIRGPLASLKGMCNVAIMDVIDPLALSYLKKLDITAEKLNTILTRLLIVNQINNSAIGLERIDFVGIVNDVLILEKKKGLPPRLKVRKHIDESIEYYSDKEFIRIILENLIDNAIKFYNDSTRVEPFVDISITEEQKHVKIRVVDNGIGISEVHPDKIFQMFSRASERSETGGIGLYITKTATEKLGGSVHLKTSPEGFTEFYVLLPFSQSRVFA